MCISTRGPTSGKMPIRFGTYNIRNGRNRGLEAALRGMSQANMDLGILQETKLTDGIYTRRSAGYSVVATDAPSQHRGSVAIFHWPAPHFLVEAVRKYGPISTSNGGAAMVHRGMLPRPRRHLDD